jgi:hypothetical protein
MATCPRIFVNITTGFLTGVMGSAGIHSTRFSEDRIGTGPYLSRYFPSQGWTDVVAGVSREVSEDI